MQPEVIGTAKVGRRLTATSGTWTPNNPVLAYQWLRAGVPILEATSSSYTVRPTDVAQRLSVRVTGSSPGITSDVVTSGLTVPATRGTLVIKARGRILGRLRAWQKLRVSSIKSTPATTINYRWRRSGIRIRGATRRAYRLRRADRGKRISVRITLKASGYTAVSYLLVRTGRVR